MASGTGSPDSNVDPLSTVTEEFASLDWSHTTLRTSQAPSFNQGEEEFLRPTGDPGGVVPSGPPLPPNPAPFVAPPQGLATPPQGQALILSEMQSIVSGLRALLDNQLMSMSSPLRLAANTALDTAQWMEVMAEFTQNSSLREQQRLKEAAWLRCELDYTQQRLRVAEERCAVLEATNEALAENRCLRACARDRDRLELDADDVVCIRSLDPSRVVLIPGPVEPGAVRGLYYEMTLHTNEPFILRAQWYISVRTVDPQGQPIDCVVTDDLEGTFRLSFLPLKLGDYTVEVRVYGVHVRGSPLKVAVQAVPFRAPPPGKSETDPGSSSRPRSSVTSSAAVSDATGSLYSISLGASNISVFSHLP